MRVPIADQLLSIFKIRTSLLDTIKKWGEDFLCRKEAREEAEVGWVGNTRQSEQGARLCEQEEITDLSHVPFFSTG